MLKVYKLYFIVVLNTCVKICIKMLAEELLDVLEIDKESRKPNSEGDLLILSDVDFNKGWDYSLPTLYTGYTPSRSMVVRDMDHFNVAFRQKYASYLSKLKYNNILIAGGAVMALLLGQDWGNDVDIFVYGLTIKQANDKVKQIIQQIYESYKDTLVDQFRRELLQENDKTDLTEAEKHAFFVQNAEVTNIRTKHCITIQLGRVERRRPHLVATQEKLAAPGARLAAESAIGMIKIQKIQIILRIYKSVDEILHGFDMGSCAVGYDGKNVMMTSLGKFSLEYMINVVDPSRRSTTYESRLLKYSRRGFQIVMPYLKIKALRTEYFQYYLAEVASLPYFTFSYQNIKENKIILSNVLRYGPKGNTRCNNSDYQPEDLDEFKIFHLNLRNVTNGGTDYYYYNTRPTDEILYDPPYITVQGVIDFYDNLSSRVFECNNLNIKLIKKYFPPEVIGKIVEEIISSNNAERYLVKLIDEQKISVLQKLSQVCLNTSELRWVTKNPGSQITGSFNPIVSNPKDWYGEYYTSEPHIVKQFEDPCVKRKPS